ncbi:MAG TPA: alfa-L-rhamnosidase, partial [Candidatus Glassbacteria bacterium]|nr:alfa-L-rhamnosidase [Candidatus Glassbacteria bacterium]
MRVSGLRCEYLVDPLGTGERQPRLSWVLESSRRSQKQTAWRVLVATSREKLAASEGDLWDSGKMAGGQTAQVVYGGKELVSGQECFWKVCAWDGDDAETEYSPAAYWSMGLLADSDWQGDWIGMQAVKAAAG